MKHINEIQFRFNKAFLPLIFSFFSISIVWTQEVYEGVLFQNVAVFNGSTNKVLVNQQVLIKGNQIAVISATPLQVPPKTKVIDGSGKTLIPGLIDVHVHMVFGSLTMRDMMMPDVKPEDLFQKVFVESEKMLLQGFTSVRDVGGPIFDLKKAIDDGVAKGPRIWPSGAMISQTAGHGDLRTPEERSRRFFGPISTMLTS